jgi:hypothetical protein
MNKPLNIYKTKVNRIIGYLVGQGNFKNLDLERKREIRKLVKVVFVKS